MGFSTTLDKNLHVLRIKITNYGLLDEVFEHVIVLTSFIPPFTRCPELLRFTILAGIQIQ